MDVEPPRLNGVQMGVRGGEIVRILDCVDPLSPTAWELPPTGSLMVAPLPKVREMEFVHGGFCRTRG